MFLGEFEHTIDDKGRLSIPAKFRPGLEEGLFVTRGLDRLGGDEPRRFGGEACRGRGCKQLGGLGGDERTAPDGKQLGGLAGEQVRRRDGDEQRAHGDERRRKGGGGGGRGGGGKGGRSARGAREEGSGGG